MQQPPRDENEEPILWCTGNPPNVTRRIHGKIVVEQGPTTAFNTLGIERRDVTMVDAAGNEVRKVYTAGAADLDMDSPYAANQKKKDRAYGWFPLGACPLALVFTRQLSRFDLDEALRTEQPCEPGTYGEKRPCPHAIAERNSRRQLQTDKMSARLPKMADLTEQLAADRKDMAEQTRLLAESFQEAVEGMGRVIGEAVRDRLPVASPAPEVAPEPPTEPPTKGKKS
jgi:hypothetical protein